MQTVDANPREVFLRACQLDVETPKPGNVSVGSDGHGMTAAQFIASAEAAAGALLTPGMAVGARILEAMTRTLDVAGCNTNLGIVLLCAPLAAALDELTPPRNASRWHEAAERTLERLDLDDARAAYRAIALANPGGLGDAPEQSVHAEPSVDLRAAMTLAAERDSIARQYASGFRDIFQTGLGAVASAPLKTPATITLNVFLTFLGTWPDSHIVRKQGVTVAQSVTREARLRHAQWRTAWARGATPPLLAWDAGLKAQGINPGTSADLTVATLFVAGCIAPGRLDIGGKRT
jgi:triphosphoribosyl-dephospho-CoA synthase